LADGSYRVGQVVPVTVTFSEVVTVTGTPQLTLSTGTPATIAVNYASGSGSATLTFTYTVAAGNASVDLDYGSTGALALNGGTIKDAAGNSATLTLASPGATHSLGANKNIVIDTAAPTVTLTAVNGSTVTFPYITGATVTSLGGACGAASGDSAIVSVSVTGTSNQAGSATCRAGAWSYTTSPALTADGTYTPNASQLDAAGNQGAAPSQPLTIDKTAPVPTSVILANGGTAGTADKGDTVSITFSETISVGSLCSTWSGNGSNQTLSANNDVTVTITNGGVGNDVLTVTSASCTFHLGSVDLGSTGWVTATRTFSGAGGNKSTISWTASTRTLLITLGSASGSVGSGIGNVTPVYTPSASIADVAGNPMTATPYSGTSSRF
jgi:hypothetical protein